MPQTGDTCTQTGDYSGRCNNGHSDSSHFKTARRSRRVPRAAVSRRRGCRDELDVRSRDEIAGHEPQKRRR